MLGVRVHVSCLGCAPLDTWGVGENVSVCGRVVWGVTLIVCVDGVIFGRKIIVVPGPDTPDFDDIFGLF